MRSEKEITEYLSEVNWKIEPLVDSPHMSASDKRILNDMKIRRAVLLWCLEPSDDVGSEQSQETTAKKKLSIKGLWRNDRSSMRHL